MRENPRSPAALAAIQELDSRGAKGWRTLAGLIRDVAPKDAGAARTVVKALAGNGQKERRDALDRAWKASLPAVVRSDLAIALAPGYPDRESRLEAALFDASLPRRAELLPLLAARGLPDETLRKALHDELLAPDAYGLLVERGVQPNAKEMRFIARRAVADSGSIAAVRAFSAALKKGRRWPLLDAIALLTGDSDEALARSAHIFMLRVSGKDVARDPDIWRSWIAARRDRYEIPDAGSPGHIAAAVFAGVEYLRKDLLDDGKSYMTGRRAGPGPGNYPVGATALSVLALRAAGVKPDDPAIKKAIVTTLLPRDVNGLPTLPPRARTHNYTASILLMALASVDAKEHRNRIQALAHRIVASQLKNGQWSYSLKDGYADDRKKPGRKTRERMRRRPDTGDNSNTQYALLALRAARRAGADVDPAVWMRAMTFWLSNLTDRGWNYSRLHRYSTSVSMTAAGLGSVAICLEGLHDKSAGERIASHKGIAIGLQALGKKLLSTSYRGQDHYAYYGVERACILTGTRLFNAFDWYREGARLLVNAQDGDGAWGFTPADGRRGKGWRFGPAIETAYALLFLKRATTPVAGGKDRGVVKVKGDRRRTRPRRRTRIEGPLGIEFSR
ncbi:MAG: hypothetical protein ACYTGZ_13720 [Planctomycetota bacterium]